MRKNTVVCRTKYNVRKPWIANHFLKRSKDKKKLWNKFKATNLQADFEQHRRFSKKLKGDLKAARVKYEKNLAKMVHKLRISTLDVKYYPKFPFASFVTATMN